uniref:Transcriptional regulator, AsnC family n=1 Tax=Parastrongyloides trichosuri TaxID=131310 RepID=A0A0N4ZXT4_PARTI
DAELPVQCGQVHRQGGGDAEGRRASAGGRRLADAGGGDRHRHRHPVRKDRGTVPALHPGRRLDDAGLRRHGAGAGDLAAADRTDGRRGRGGERAGRRLDLLVRGAAGGGDGRRRYGEGRD